MQKFVVEGGRRLEGAARVSGSKNAALPLLAATLMADDPCVLRGVPRLADVLILCDLLRELGVEVRRDRTGALRSRPRGAPSCVAPYELVQRMRASICVLGPLLGRRGRAQVSYPGGCVIGVRPIDLHLKGLEALGAQLEVEHGYIHAKAPPGGLRGAAIYLGGSYGPSVTGTANVLMAAVFAQGTTVLEAAACEPEVEDLVHFLNRMGARIEGAGTPTLRIEGVARLGGAEHVVIEDRIEAGTLLLAAAITGGDVTVEGARAEHLRALLDLLRQLGVRVTEPAPGVLRVRGTRHPRAVDLTTLPYPGFPTDLQAPMMALLSVAEGLSLITERIYPDRFMHVPELNRLGARIRKDGPSAVVTGVETLSGAPVQASDLRAGAALVLAGLVARGRTEVFGAEHIDRGYEGLERKLSALGAAITREDVVFKRRKADLLARRLASERLPRKKTA